MKNAYVSKLRRNYTGAGTLDVVGITEIATMGGVSSQAATNWRSRFPDFPLPIAELASGPIFRRDEAKDWLKRNNRKLAELTPGPNLDEVKLPDGH